MLRLAQVNGPQCDHRFISTLPNETRAKQIEWKSIWIMLGAAAVTVLVALSFVSTRPNVTQIGATRHDWK